MINVTKTHLPNKEKYKKYIDKIYGNGWITNNGPLVRKLEKRLAKHLGVRNLVLVANGTIALEIAYRALEIKNEVITTPFSFVATTSSIMTTGLEPIFSDINPKTLNIDVIKIKEAINKNTSAIVPVHVFGNGCDVEEIDYVVKDNNLKLIYDASHAFDVIYKGQSILNFGDISTLSFHATKLFHTIEGGALIINDEEITQKVRSLINFGIDNPESISNLGTNAKMNEFEAAMGLCMLDEIDLIAKKRKAIYDIYNKELSGTVVFQEQNKNSSLNFSYFPIILKDVKQMRKVQMSLNENEIYPRRYFYPSLDTLNYINPKQIMPISRDISNRILCLPLYSELDLKEVRTICYLIKEKL